MTRGSALVLLMALGLGAIAGVFGAPALAILGPLFIGLCVVWPAVGIVALIAACALDRFAVSVGGPNVRPDELAALALAAALVIRAVMRPRTRSRGPKIPTLPAAAFSALRGPRWQTRVPAKPATAVAWQTTDTAVSRATDRGPHRFSIEGPAVPETSEGPRVAKTSRFIRERLSPNPLFGEGLGGGISPGSPGGGGGGERRISSGSPGGALGRRPRPGDQLAMGGGGEKGQATPRWGAASIPLLLPVLAYLVTNALATLTSDDPARGISLDLITLDLAILYGALVVYLTTPARLLWGVRVWLGVSAIEAVIGLLAFALYLGAHAVVPGVQLDPNSGNAPLVYGTLYEGNIFGSYMSAAFLMALALAAEETVRRKSFLYVVLAATAVGLLVSGTRSAWGATVVGAVALLLLLRLGRSGRRSRLLLRVVGGLVAVGLIVGVGLAVLPASVTGAFGARAQGLLNFGSGSGYGRVLLYREALTEWQGHPLLGLGPGSFAYKLSGDTSTSAAWLPNLTLLALHDTGILGLLALLWLFAAFYVMAIGALRRAPPGELRAALAGLIAAITAMLVAFQLTPGFNLGYSWALLALGAAAARAIGQASARSTPRLEPAAA